MNLSLTSLTVRFHRLAMVVTSLVVLTACGSTTARESSTLGSSSLDGSQTGLIGSGSGSGNINNLQEADSYVAQINGAGGAVPTVTYNIQTSTTLKVKVTPLGAPNLTLPGYTNWSFPYGCLRLRVTVNGVTKTTNVLRVDGVSQGATSVCKDAPTYQILDFQSSISGGSATPVVISNGEYDNCRYTWPLNYGCQMSPLFQNHEIAASIQIQGDNRWMDP